MMYYKFIKLTSGDSIIAATEDSCTTFKNKEFLKVFNPVQVGSMRFPRNGVIIESHVFMPWIAMSASENVMLPTKNIVVTVDVDEKVAEQYDNYVQKTEQRLLINETGSLPSGFFDEIDDEDLDEEEEENGDDDGRTIH